tara:strand:- start:19 stop:1581 length:1563 start_codon:yes stop_codon:yes gene_type:complete
VPVGAYVTLEVDWDDDGNFANANSDISSDVLDITWSRGRDSASQLSGRAVAGQLQAKLKNEDNLYNSFNSDSDLSGKLLPGLAVRLQLSSVSPEFDYTFPITFPEVDAAWRGYLDSISPSFLRTSGKQLLLRATGSLARIAARETAEVAASTSIRTGAAITLVINDADSSVPTNIDTGETTMTRWWTAEQPALQAIRAIEESEVGYVGESPTGQIVFESRQHRLIAPHITSQGTFSDAADATLTYAAIEQIDPMSEIYNTMNANVQLYTVAGSATVLWTLAESGANSPALRAGAAKIFVARFPTAASATNARHVNAWTTTAATTDMLANAAADGTGTNLTSDIGISVAKYSESMNITLTNNSTTDGFITKLQARGTAVTADDPLKIVEEDSTSQASFGKRTFPLKGPFIPSEQDARDLMAYLLSIHKDPMRTMRITWDGNKDSTHGTKARELDISDRVTIIADNRSGLGISEDFFIEHMQHNISQKGQHKVTYECSEATAYAGFWVLDVGKLGTSTRLAV